MSSFFHEYETNMTPSFKVKLSGLLICVVAAHAHDIEAGHKYELQGQHFVNDQALDLYLKKLQNDFARKKMAP